MISNSFSSVLFLSGGEIVVVMVVAPATGVVVAVVVFAAGEVTPVLVSCAKVVENAMEMKVEVISDVRIFILGYSLKIRGVRHGYGLITAASVASLTTEFHWVVSVTVSNKSNHPPTSNHSELRIEYPSR